MWRTVLIYGSVLALGAVALQWVEYQVWVRTHPSGAWLALIATAFLGLGVWVGARLFQRAAPAGAFAANTRALDSLRITPREHEVLTLLAEGRSNKEIAGRLHVSPHTVKTHVAKLYEKLEAVRRTDAVRRARDLGLVP